MYTTMRLRAGEEELEDAPEAVERLGVMQVLQTVKAWMQLQADELTWVMEHAVRQAHMDLLFAVDAIAERTRRTHGDFDLEQVRQWWPNVSEEKASKMAMNNEPTLQDLETRRNTAALRKMTQSGGGSFSAKKRRSGAGTPGGFGQGGQAQGSNKYHRTSPHGGRGRGGGSNAGGSGYGRGLFDGGLASRGGRGRGQGRGGFRGGGRGGGRGEASSGGASQ